MITGIYAGILAVFFAYLSIQVIKLRRTHGVSLGDSRIPELQKAIAAHNNAAQYIPITLLLSLLLELQGIHWVLIHIAGLILCAGRFIHAASLLSRGFKKRVLGMQLTFAVLIFLALLNVFWPLYQYLTGLKF